MSSGKHQALMERTTGKHTGYGKVILFGEHFVVFGADAIVAGISEYTDCSLELTRGVPGVQVVDNRPAVPGYKTEKRAEQEKAHQLVLHHLKIDTSKDGLKITLGGPLVPSSGIGASASDVVALSRALSEMYGLKLSEAEVNQSAFVGEGGYHGTPSGVDNTAATFGGLINFKREAGKAVFNRVQFYRPMHLIVAATGITASTTKVVGDVRKLKETDPTLFNSLQQQYLEAYSLGLRALHAGDWKKVGQQMQHNHAVLQQLGVSCPELDAIVKTSMVAGACGAKMAGTGRGGIAVVLCDSEADRTRIVGHLKQHCPAAKFIWEYTVNPVSSKL